MLKVGVSLPRPSRVEDLMAVELLSGAPQLPRSRVLSQWRGQISEGTDAVLCAPRSFVDPGPDDILEAPFFPFDRAMEAWNRIDAARTALGSSVVLLRTGARFRPTDRNRQLLMDFGLAIAQPDVKVAWAPSGLWDPDMVQDVAASASLFVARDPVAAGSFDSVSDWQYVRIMGLGRARLGRGDLELLAEMIQDSGDGVCILATGDERSDRRQAQRLLEMVQDDEPEPG
ncbi:MAG: hypothetical protein J7M25_15815 [Deltaproteobacteria bacterium]|nr:hypothetical protein [Deltaproteobacteria bacterium]